MSEAPACACPENAYQNGNTCQCSIGYYYNSSTVCTPCKNNCATCDTDPNTCDTCIDSVHMSAAPACQCPARSTLVNGVCICNNGYYYSETTTCSRCSSQCATCSQSSTNCGSCSDTIHMSSAPDCSCPDQATLIGISCLCNAGYYFSTNTTCSAIDTDCAPQCAQCSSYDFCTACNDRANTFLNTVTGTCRCWDPYASFNQSTRTCQCIQGYYLSSSGVCQICMPPCAQCSTSATFCTECNDFANMDLNAIKGSCKCKNDDFEFNPWTKVCQSNPGSCETVINNLTNNTYINVTNIN